MTNPSDADRTGIMESYEIRRLVVDRRRACGIGLCGGYEQIARWLFREHNIVTSASWIAGVIADEIPEQALKVLNIENCLFYD